MNATENNFNVREVPFYKIRLRMHYVIFKSRNLRILLLRHFKNKKF